MSGGNVRRASSRIVFAAIVLVAGLLGWASPSAAEPVDPPPTDLTVTALETVVWSQDPFVHAAVATRPGTVRARGTMTYSEDGATLATIALGGAGSAVYRTRTLEVGVHRIDVAYSGDASYLPATGSVEVTVTKASTTTAVASLKDPVAKGARAYFRSATQRVAPAEYPANLAGTAMFVAHPEVGLPIVAAGVPVNSSGFAVWQPALPEGRYVVTVQYDENDHWVGSTSWGVEQVVGTPPVVEPNVDPVPVASPTVVPDELTVSFIGSGSYDPDGSVVGWVWIFGDGSAASTEVNPSHTYASPGLYSVILIVTDDRGATASTTFTITLTLPPPNEAPTAVVGATPTSGAAPLTVDLTSAGSTDPDGTITTYNWVFGDGEADTGETVAHIYADPGTYVLSLTVTDNRGATHTASVTITVTEPIPPTFASVDGGDQHTCGVMTDGTVACWGWNSAGQLGDGTTTSRPTPALVSGITDATAVAGGAEHTCALHAGGTVSCWGRGTAGQLGNGSTVDSPTPVAVTGLTDAVSLSAGWLHTCALRSTGAISCWGYAAFGSLGAGSIGPVRSTPIAVTGISDATHVDAGGPITCAVHGGGAVSCWGLLYSPLDTGIYDFVLSPVGVTGISDATAVAAGAQHVCALRGEGAVSCWGGGAEGQLGDGLSDSTPTPVTVTGITDAVAIDAATQTCVLRADGTVACWGRGVEGQLGNGSTATQPAPVSVTGIGDALGITTGQAHTCALRPGGSASCWGWGTEGQLGDGGTSNSSTPVTVLDLP